MKGERHSCALVSSAVARLLPSRWSRRRCLTVFGLVSGLSWVMVPVAMFGVREFERLSGALVVGPITGLVMAFSLAKPLARLGREGTLVVGLFALPGGAFVYGLLLWCVGLIRSGLVLGGPMPLVSPIGVGGQALVGLVWVWPLALLATPLAVWTTFQLRGVAARNQR